MLNNYSIVTLKKTDPYSFIKYWKQFYDYKNEEIYQEFIQKKIFSEKDIEQMFWWKNAMKLSSKKNKSVTFVQNNLQTVNSLKKHFDLDLFNQTFKSMGAIWKIFLLHAISPNEFPIFDQHVYRAFYYIKNKKVEEVSNNNLIKFQIYIQDYLSFFRDVKSQSNCLSKEIDEALWVFGRYIKRNPNLFNS